MMDTDLNLHLIKAIDVGSLTSQLQTHIDQKTKPVGALGQLEALARQIGLIQHTLQPSLMQPQVLVFAGDHGLAAQGVSAYPSEVTWQMVENFLAGGAAISVFSRQHQLALHVVDCGVNHSFQIRPQLLNYKIAAGTMDCSLGPAMSLAQCQQAIENGRQIVQALPGNAILLGEMGIGNTSSAALIMAKLLGRSITDCAGRGTGLDDEKFKHKLAVLEKVLRQHQAVTGSLPILAAVGGFEIATMVGAILEAAQARRVVVVDGFITTAAVLVAHALQPNILDYCIFSHCSDEAGHAAMLDYLQVKPLLKLNLRLGEGSGAALAWPLLQSACFMLCDMASFSSAHVSTAPVEA